ncbi:hypothetical protein FGB62_22g443 [Gracilaria domingensis]|nr:hypothetical protein FGB62_22g443 [Gracilaria domingensis]
MKRQQRTMTGMNKSVRRGRKQKEPMRRNVCLLAGNSVKIITEHEDGRSTFSKPRNQIPNMDQLQTPPLLRRNPVLLSGVNDDSDMDTLSATRAPSRVSDSPSRLLPVSPSRGVLASPVQGPSLAERARDRQSFGLFYDEDITIAVRGNNLENVEEDTTQPLPSVRKPLTELQSSEADDGDITCTLGFGFHELMNEARYDEAPLPSASENLKSPKNSNTVPEQRNLLRDYGNFEDSALSPQTDVGKATEFNAKENGKDCETQKSIASHGGQEAQPREIPGRENIVQSTSLKNAGYLEREGVEPFNGLESPEETHSKTGQKDDASMNEIDMDVTTDITPKAPSMERLPSGSKPQSNLHESDSKSLDLPSVPNQVSDVENQPAMAEYEGLLDSALASSAAPNSDVDSEVVNSLDFNLDELLGRLDVRFDIPTRSAYRDVSIAPFDSIPPKFDPSSSEFAVYECGKEQYYMNRLHSERNRLKEEIASVMDSIRSSEEEIQIVRPPLVQMLTDYGDRSSKRGTDLHCSVKRLRKTCTFEAKEMWVDSRKMWEGEISGQLATSADVLEKDHAAVEADESKDSHEKYRDPNQAQRLLIRDASFVKDLRDFIATQELDKVSFLKKLAVLEPMEMKLSNERHELKLMENDPLALTKRVAQKREEFSMIAAVTGVRIKEISINLISLTLCGLADINFSLHEDRIINTACKPVRLFGRGEKAKFQALIDDAVKVLGSAASVKSIKFVRDIPPMLRRFAYTLMRTQHFLEEACRYYMKHLGSLNSSAVIEVDGNLRHRVLVTGLFYSMPLRSHFDIVISWTVYPSEDGENTHQEIVVEEIKRTVGQSPDDNTLRAAIQKGKRLELFSIFDAFTAVWDLL